MRQVLARQNVRKSKMHVLIISQIFPPDMGGSSTRAFNVAKGLSLNGLKVTVIAGFPHYPTGEIPKHLRRKALSIEYMSGFKVIRTFIPPLPAKGLVNRMILFITFLISSLFPLFFVRRVDVVFASNPQILAIMPGLVYSTFHRCPVILNVDDLWPEDPIDIGVIKSEFMKKIGELLAGLAYKTARLITPISPGYIKIICNKYGVPKSKIHVVRGGVDSSKFKLVPIKEGGKFVVLYSGAFSVAYDFDQILLAARSLEKMNDLEFILQGGGELAQYLKIKVEKLKLKNVKIIHKILNREEVAKLLSEADALILPLRNFGRPYLGISSKLYEYQAAGKPIICCAEGQPAEYVEKTSSGIVVKPGDYISLAETVLYLKNDRKICEELGRSGRKCVEEKLDIEKIGSKMKQIFESIVETEEM